MFWFLLAVVLICLYFGAWAVIVGHADPDEEALRDYARQRAEFERWFQ